MDNFLIVVSGLAWTIVYIDSIRIGLKVKTYAMPFWALSLNIAWELLHAIFGYREVGLTLQIAINVIWFLFDLGLLYTFFRYGRRYFPQQYHSRWFYAWGIFGLLTAFILQFTFIHEFGLLMGAVYSAFLQNLLMSILFIVMLAQRNSSEGQTLLIAVSKCIGTLAPTIFMGDFGIGSFMEPNRLVLVTGGLIFFFDLAYIWLLSKAKSREKVSVGQNTPA
jgi:hypothetical protein